MSRPYPPPRNYYLLVHDALRHIVGKDAELQAFVKTRKPFQCDILVNSELTDPDLAKANPNYVKDFSLMLQTRLSSCSLEARERRIDVVFPDNELLHLALGAPRKWISGLQTPVGINQEPDWRRRNRLRISLGFDEDLFTACCSFGLNLAARSLEKWTYDFYKYRTPMLALFRPELAQQFQMDRHVVVPPITYWQAHCYALQMTYPCSDYQRMYHTVRQNFFRYYKIYPFDNPYCAGEDLNTMRVAKDLCGMLKRELFTDDDEKEKTDTGLPLPWPNQQTE